MNNKTRIFLVTTFSAVLIAAAFAAPPVTHTAGAAVAVQQGVAPSQAAQTQSASGTISAVDKASFTITLPLKSSVATVSAVQDAPKTMTFTIDKNTTIEGKLAVGASADVTYRDDNGQHVAIGVRVTPPQS